MYALILFALLGLLAPRGKTNNRDYVKNKPDSEGPSFPIPLPVINVPPFPTDEERTKQEKRDRKEKWKFRLEIAGFIVLALYAGFTIATWLQVKRSADSTKVAADAAADNAKLTRQQIEGTDAAILEASAFYDGPFGNCRISVDNRGKVNAKNIE